MATPLVLTADPALLDDLLRLAAAAGVEPDVAARLADAGPRWRTAPFVLLGYDLAADAVAAGLPRRPGVAVVARRPEDASVWRSAVGIGAEHVTLLPDAEPWFVERLAALADTRPRATVVAVVAARGGGGATTLAIGLALAGARAGWRTMLVDVDPYGGGIDAALGAEDLAGPRWDDLASGGVVPGGHGLVDVLPRCGEVTVLAWPREGPSAAHPAAVETLLTSARRATELVVVDAGRSFGDVSRAALAAADVTYVVCPAEVRACLAAVPVVATVETYVEDVRLVVRGPVASDLEPEHVAESLGLPLAGWLAPEPGIDGDYDAGHPPGRRGSGPLAAFCDALVAGLPRPPAPAAANLPPPDEPVRREATG